VTKRRDLIGRITHAAAAAGIDWKLAREGGAHSIYSLDGLRVSIRRHNEINEQTARGIYRQCAAKLVEGWWM